MAYLPLNEARSAEAQMMPWQHTSYLSLNFVRKICDFESIILYMLEVV